LGIIQKQALRNTLIGFTGAGIGAASRLLMPFIVSERQIGLFQLLDSVSGIFISFLNLGFSQLLARMFPRYKNEQNGHHGFLLFGVFLSLLGIFISFFVYYFLGDQLFSNGKDSDLMRAFSFLVFPLLFFRIIARNMDPYVSMLHNSIFGNFFDNFVTKLIFLVSLLTYALSWIDFNFLVYLYAINLCLPGLALLIYAFFLTQKITLPHPEFRQKNNHKEIVGNLLFGIMLSASSSILLYIDSLMINKMLSTAALGIYASFFFAARLLNIPANSMNRIAGVILAESWAQNDLKNIQSIYIKSSLNQLIIATYMLGVGWACLDAALVYLPGYEIGKYVFLFIGLALLVEMSTGVNTAIIATSKKYKYNTYFNITLALLAVLSNYYFIKSFGMVGAAIASFVTMVTVNTTRWYFLYRIYNLQPFNKHYLKTTLVCVVFFIGCCLIDFPARPLLKIGINIIVLSLVFWGVIIKMKLSEDINTWFKKMKHKFTH
jgi:O-antigen/teichoic acid export membrane protein